MPQPPFKRPLLDLIRQRASWRNYRPEPLAPAAWAALEAALGDLPSGPFAESSRFALVSAFASDPKALRQLGTYGNIQGATTFIAGAVADGPRALEAFGYRMEIAILRATDLGLGTCWLGGTFNRGGFGAALGVRPGELMPAISPVGEVASERGVLDRFLRWSANSKNRLPAESLFTEPDFATPLAADSLGRWAEALEMVRLAPSASNRQPWRVVAEPGSRVFHFYLRRSLMYARVAKTFVGADDLQRVDMGIALCHFELAAAELGLPGRWIAVEPAGLSLPDRTEYCLTWNAV